MLKAVVDAGVPALVCFAMVVVGMELTTDDFRRVASQPRTVVAASVGQFLLLPVIGWLLMHCHGLQFAAAQADEALRVDHQPLPHRGPRGEALGHAGRI